MPLKAVVEKIEDVEEAFRGLYTAQDGKHVLTGVEGMVPKAQLDAVKTEAGGYRIDLKKTKDALALFGDLDPVKTAEQLARIPELEIAAAGKIDDKKVDQIVETRIAAKLAPVQRNLDLALGENKVLKDANENMTKAEKTRVMGDQIRTAGKKAGVLDSAIEDAILLGERILEFDDTGALVVKDKVGYTPGINPEDWFVELQPKRPHWWGASQGGGAGGGKGGPGFTGPNPFTHEGWNMTEQGKLYKADPKKAAALATAAGTSRNPRNNPTFSATDRATLLSVREGNVSNRSAKTLQSNASHGLRHRVSPT